MASNVKRTSIRILESNSFGGSNSQAWLAGSRLQVMDTGSLLHGGNRECFLIQPKWSSEVLLWARALGCFVLFLSAYFKCVLFIKTPH